MAWLPEISILMSSDAADILRGCAKALDHTSEQYGTDVKIDTIQFDRGNGMVKFPNEFIHIQGMTQKLIDV